jgi:myo-inositol-1(or 4)-monophosphatase
VPDRAQLAVQLALEAGAFIREAMGAGRNVEHKSAVDLVTDVDRGSEALVIAGIRAAFPSDTIVAEEDSAGRGGVRPSAPKGLSWCIDPLDGTTNFVHGLPHFAVSIAVLDDGAPRAAAVYDPCKDELFRAERGGGAFAGNASDRAARRLSVSAVPALDEALLVTGFPYDRREHADVYLRYFRDFMCSARDLRRYGSASLDLCYVAAGRFDGFFEWKLHPWDTAAGWLVVEEAGGRVTDFGGGGYDAWLPRILATNGTIHDEALALLSRIAAETGEFHGH